MIEISEHAATYYRTQLKINDLLKLAGMIICDLSTCCDEELVEALIDELRIVLIDLAKIGISN